MKSEKNEYAKAYGEVIYILQQLEQEDFDKIPPKLIKLLEKKRDKKWRFQISFEKPLLEQNLLKETKAILAVIYHLYLSDSLTNQYNMQK